MTRNWMAAAAALALLTSGQAAAFQTPTDTTTEAKPAKDGTTAEERSNTARLAIQLVHRGLAAPGVGVVEAGHVVVHQRGAVQQLDRHRRGVGEFGRVFTAGPGDGQAELGADAGAAGEHRVPHGGHQSGRGTGAARAPELLVERVLDA